MIMGRVVNVPTDSTLGASPHINPNIEPDTQANHGNDKSGCDCLKVHGVEFPSRCLNKFAMTFTSLVVLIDVNFSLRYIPGMIFAL